MISRVILGLSIAKLIRMSQPTRMFSSIPDFKILGKTILNAVSNGHLEGSSLEAQELWKGSSPTVLFIVRRPG